MQMHGNVFTRSPFVITKTLSSDHFRQYSGASSKPTPFGSKKNCRLKQSVGLSISVYRENRKREAVGLSRDPA